MSKYKLLPLFFVLLILMAVYPTNGKTTVQSLTIKTIYVDDDAPPEWYDETHFKTIMDAINNSNDGDTVFVYNGAYYEETIINKSINLIGENKYYTIIDGSYNPAENLTTGLSIYAECTVVKNFTIQNFNYTGVSVNLNNNNISDNIIKNVSSVGIIAYGTNHTIYNNIIVADGKGISSDSDDSLIEGNNITSASDGIFLDRSNRNTITLNNVQGCDRGAVFFKSNNNIIKRNNIAHNTDNVFLALSWRNGFYENNFIDCDNIGKHVALKGYSFFNKWRGNYWDNQIIHILPKIILGRFGILPVPWLNIDWRPARTPYDI